MTRKSFDSTAGMASECLVQNINLLFKAGFKDATCYSDGLTFMCSSTWEMGCTLYYPSLPTCQYPTEFTEKSGKLPLRQKLLTAFKIITFFPTLIWSQNCRRQVLCSTSHRSLLLFVRPITQQLATDPLTDPSISTSSSCPRLCQKPPNGETEQERRTNFK